MNHCRLYVLLLAVLWVLAACVLSPPLMETVVPESQNRVTHTGAAPTVAHASQDLVAVTPQVEATTKASPTPSTEITAAPSLPVSSAPSPETITPECFSCEATVAPEMTANDVDLLELCGIPATPAQSSVADWIYFRESDGSTRAVGWYRTNDQFASVEAVAPWGYLSRDLNYLVTFDCGARGSICVASPPTDQPSILTARYELDYDPRNKVSPSHRAYWLGDNSRLVFKVITSYIDPEDNSDFTSDERLYFLNVETGELEQIAQNTDLDFLVSPVGDCAVVRHGTDGLVNLIAFGSDGVRDAIRLPDRIAEAYGWRAEADWSPDGRKIATTTGNGDAIHIVDLQTGTVERIVPCDYCLVSGLRWSPDGKRLFFTDVRNLYIVDPETESTLWAGASWGLSAHEWTHWLPDGKSLVTAGSQSFGTMLYRLGDHERLPFYEPLMLSDGTLSQDVTDLFWKTNGIPATSPTP